jgi:hypothetical protein
VERRDARPIDEDHALSWTKCRGSVAKDDL